jgi:hypothetical protein
LPSTTEFEAQTYLYPLRLVRFKLFSTATTQVSTATCVFPVFSCLLFSQYFTSSQVLSSSWIPKTCLCKNFSLLAPHTTPLPLARRRRCSFPLGKFQSPFLTRDLRLLRVASLTYNSTLLLHIACKVVYKSGTSKLICECSQLPPVLWHVSVVGY